MRGTWDLVIIVLAYIFAVLGIAQWLRSRFSADTTRRIVHILAADIIVVLPLFASLRWVLMIPAILAVVVVVGLALGLPIRRSLVTEGDNPLHAYGPVYYIISIAIMIAVFGTKSHIPIAATFVMAWGDGFAALIGRNLGYHRLFNGKSLEGFLAFFAFSFLGVVVSLTFWSHFSGLSLPVLGLALVGALTGSLIEIASIGKLAPFDNFTVPLGVALVLFLLG